MSVLEDLVSEVKSYPHTYLTLEVIEVEPDGLHINAGEDAHFTLQVSNSGTLDVHDLRLLVTGKHGTQVKGPGAAAVFAHTALSNTFDLVRAHRPNEKVTMPGGRMIFKAPATEKDLTELLEVSVDTWNTDLDHPLIDHSDPDPEASTTYSAEVLPPT